MMQENNKVVYSIVSIMRSANLFACNQTSSIRDVEAQSLVAATPWDMSQ
jgi:hypothetical protein